MVDCVKGGGGVCLWPLCGAFVSGKRAELGLGSLVMMVCVCVCMCVCVCLQHLSWLGASCCPLVLAAFACSKVYKSKAPRANGILACGV